MRLRHTLLLLALLPMTNLLAAVPKDHLDKYGRGIIQDYTDMKDGGDIEWVWVAPGTRLSTYQFKMGKFENLSKSVDDDMVEVVEEDLPRALAKAGKSDASAPTLTVDTAIFWAERANRAKIWIPYAGLHVAQAGVGVELVFRDSSGKIVAKIRHSGREGEQLEAAAEELVDDLTGYIRGH